MSEAVREAPKKQRPQFRNIHVTELGNYRMPLASIVSILHRISGFIMFAGLPVILYMLQQSLLSEDTFKYFAAIMAHPLVKLVTLGLLWGYFHHFCAGVRHLFMDMHIGIEKNSSRQSAATVLVISLLLTFITALKLFGVF
ncbi:succinate dehydrogenase, cytochrome b556 subunit [Massilia sp. DWR3-1-1]|uniref:succinate dehydrogenase, cytochrome b556 subunit n=1 Tax=Massilia sp. DWR3-1-1 TaxID=2804559 RepID=UPI003CEBF1B6